MTSNSLKSDELLGRKSIKKALQDWNELKNMGLHPLCKLNIVQSQRKLGGYSDTPAGDGLALREVLKEAIETLKPAEEEPSNLTEPWRSYIILTERFIAGRSQEYIENRLAIGRRTYYRAQNEAFDRLADKLREREQKSTPPKEEAVPEASEEALAEPAVPFMAPPQPSQMLIGRDQMLAGLRRRLFAGDSLALFALNGLPGVGKTALAIALAHDTQIREYFCDGILWAGLGQQPDLPTHLGTWGLALGIPPRQMGQFATIETKARAIHAAIGTRRMLLMIDDAWDIHEALAFQLGGPNCAHILTTRLPDLAWDFAQEGAKPVHELNQGESLALLAQFVPQLVIKQPEEARRLVKAVDGLPLALILMGRYLQKAIHLEGQKALPHLLEQLQLIRTRLALSMPHSPLTKQPSLPYGVPLSLLASIEISDNALEEPARQVLRALSVFLPKPNTFSQEAALAVAASPLPTLKMLTEAGLVESSGTTRLTMHQVIADYASLPSPPAPSPPPLNPPQFWGASNGRGGGSGENPPLPLLGEGLGVRAEGRLLYHQRAATYFADFAHQHGTSGYNQLDLDWQNIASAMQWAYNHQQWTPLIKGVEGLTEPNLGIMGFMDARGHWKHVRALLNNALEGARATGDKQAEATILTKIGTFAFRQADKGSAEQHLTQSLSLLEQLPNREEIILQRTHCYEFLARLEMGREIEAAHEWIDRGLTELEGLDSEAARHQKGYFNVLLSELNGRTGRFPEAIAAAEQGLTLLPPEPSSARVVAFIVLGNVFALQGQIQQAIEYQKEGIKIAEELGDSRRLATLWMNVGNNQGFRSSNLFAAIGSYQKALELYQQMGDTDGECRVYINLGLIYIMLGEDEPALSYLTTANSSAQKHGLIRREAYAKTNLAHLEIFRGQLVEAASALTRAHQLCLQLELAALLPGVLRWQAEIARLSEEHDKAFILIKSSLQFARSRGRLLAEGIGCSIKGKILDGMKRFLEAEAAHQTSLQLLADQSPYDLATSQLAFGEHYLLRDGYVSERAKSLLMTALMSFERIGAKREIALAKRLLN